MVHSKFCLVAVKILFGPLQVGSCEGSVWSTLSLLGSCEDLFQSTISLLGSCEDPIQSTIGLLSSCEICLVHYKFAW